MLLRAADEWGCGKPGQEGLKTSKQKLVHLFVFLCKRFLYVRTTFVYGVLSRYLHWISATAWLGCVRGGGGGGGGILV